MHRRVTRIGHNAVHDPLRRLRRVRVRAPSDERLGQMETVEQPGAGPRHGGEASPEVEVRLSARRRKTSEAKWVGGRIVVSLPAHLDVESRQKTIDWLVERLLTRERLQRPAGDDELLARAVALSDRYGLGSAPGLGALGDQPVGPLGVVLVLLGPDPRLAPPAGGAGVGARLGVGPRGGAPDLPRPFTRVPSSRRFVPAPRARRGPSWPATAWAWRTPCRRRATWSPARALCATGFRRVLPPGSGPAGAGSRSPRPA